MSGKIMVLVEDNEDQVPLAMRALRKITASWTR